MNGEAARQRTIRSCEQHCMNEGCDRHAEYPAPCRSGATLFFCLEHVRRYNAEWNIFKDMTEEEAVRFRRAAMAGERETYVRHGGERRSAKRQAEEPLYSRSSYTSEQINALSVLNLAPPVNRRTVRERYLALVKECHPDVASRAGAAACAERMKEINAAYLTLKSALPL